MQTPFRLAVLNTHPIQYFAPLFRYLSQGDTVKVTALYCTDFSLRGAVDPGFKQPVTWDVDLLSGYQHVYLGDAATHRVPKGFWSLVCPEVWGEVRSGKYDGLLLHGYNHAANLIAFAAAKSIGLPVFMRSETHLGLRRQPWKQWLRDSALSIWYRLFDGFFSIGTANRAYYRSLAVPDQKIFNFPYTVDNDRFISAATLTTTERTEVRKRFGLDDDVPVVLYASKLMPRKHPDDVIRAVALLRSKGVRASLLMVGTGEMDAELRSLAQQLALTDVVFAGFINQAELPKILAASDIFVLPAEGEPWGLIVNEAMCAGLPVVVSAEVGCVPDLVHDGVNGFLIDPCNVVALAGSLETLVINSAVRAQMSAVSISKIRNWSYRECQIGLAECVQYLQRSARALT
jgi:glycosyltransferase involved in cell wall biosynthesis